MFRPLHATYNAPCAFGVGCGYAAGETPNLGIIFEPHILLPILGLAALAALPIVIKALRGQKDI